MSGSCRVLSIATVAQSLAYQSPAAWSVLLERGCEMTFAAAPDEHVEQLTDIGSFEPLRLRRNLDPRRLAGGALDLHRQLSRSWDLIQVQSPIVAAMTRVLPTSAPVVYVAHGFHFHSDGGRITNAAYGAVEQVLARRTRAIAVVSGEDFAAGVRRGMHRRTCLWRLPGAGVDLDRFALRGRQAADGPHVAFIGELNHNKDPLLVLDLVERLRSRGSGATATLVGDGPLREQVRQRVGQISGATWVPHTDRPEVVLAESDVLVLPSRREGLPRVVIETLATGRPVVARSNRGTRELVTSPELGRLLEPSSSVDEWADAVLSVSDMQVDGSVRRESVVQYGVQSFSRSYGRLVDLVLSGQVSRGVFDLDDQEAHS